MAVSTKTRGTGKNANKMTPEIYFARKLASNEKKIRDKALKKLKRWIAARSSVPDAFNNDELMKLWRGLFYCMWMSDKPLIQEDLAETISGLVHSVVDRKLGLKFVEIALKTLAKSWSGIDNWRMDKFLMFVRRLIRHSLEYMAAGGWNEEEVAIYTKMLSDTIVNANKSSALVVTPVGLQLHVINIFPEELAKAGGEDFASSTILKMLEPFAKCLATSTDGRVKKEVFEHVFRYLMRQSDEALEYEAKGIEREARLSMRDVKPKRKKGRKSTQTTESVSEEEEKENQDENVEEETREEGSDDDVDDAGSDGDEDMEMEESNFVWGAKDPRAGGVDAFIPQMRPNYGELADLLFKMGSEKSVRPQNRKGLFDLVQKFRDLNAGIYPLAIKFHKVSPGLTPKMMKAAAKNFLKEELANAEARRVEKLEMRKAKKTSDPKVAFDAEDFLMEGLSDADFVREVQEEGDLGGDDEGSDVEDENTEDELTDEEDEVDEEEDEDDDEEVEGDDEEELELSDEDELEISDEDELEISDEDELASEEAEEEQEEEEIIVPAAKLKGKAANQPKKALSKSAGKLATFEVENDWEEEAVSPATMQQLKQKLKAGKRPKNSGWSESPLKGEVEIVIPNKKFKGADKLQPVQTPSTPENPKDTSINSRNRRVNFVLNKNTAQEPKDYQESIRKSPGVPHDPDRQPSGGGVLKRNDSNSSKTTSPSTRKPQRGGRNARTSRI